MRAYRANCSKHTGRNRVKDTITKTSLCKGSQSKFDYQDRAHTSQKHSSASLSTTSCICEGRKQVLGQSCPSRGWSLCAGGQRRGAHEVSAMLAGFSELGRYRFQVKQVE